MLIAIKTIIEVSVWRVSGMVGRGVCDEEGDEMVMRLCQKLKKNTRTG